MFELKTKTDISANSFFELFTPEFDFINQTNSDTMHYSMGTTNESLSLWMKRENLIELNMEGYSLSDKDSAISLRKHNDYIFKTSKSLTRLLNPDFDKIVQIQSIYESVIKKYHIAKIEEMNYIPELKSHLSYHDYNQTFIQLGNKNILKIIFNKEYFKHSVAYFDLYIMFLVHSDLTVHPYFHLKIPYLPSKKISFIIHFNNPDKAYITMSPDTWIKGFIDKKTPTYLDELNISTFIDNLIYSSLINTLKTSLDLKDIDFSTLSDNQINDYLLLLKMKNI